ncbi:MAG: hypothetical protein AAGM21_06075 [Pseudomonadota bacterium]
MRWIIIGICVLALAGLGVIAPVAMNAANTAALTKLANGDGPGAVETFETLARFGHADAINNLGVIRLRGMDGTRDRDAAMALFERAFDKGHKVAGYNLARLAENKHATPMEEVAVTLARLDPLVRAGDPHAAAEMARHLYYNNRDALVPAIHQRRIDLLEQAAASGDRVYTYLYARELWKVANPDGTAMMIQAVETMLQAANAGEPRAMLHMGDMHWQSRSSFKEAFEGGYPGGDKFHWWSLGAKAGDMASTCRFAVNWFRDLRRRDTPLPVHRGPIETPDAETMQALAHVQTCAEAGKRPRIANPVFGVPALYLGRPMGGFETYRSSSAFAQMIYGMILLEGRLVPRDAERGRAYLGRAAENNTSAKTVLRAVDGFRPE